MQHDEVETEEAELDVSESALAKDQSRIESGCRSDVDAAAHTAAAPPRIGRLGCRPRPKLTLSARFFACFAPKRCRLAAHRKAAVGQHVSRAGKGCAGAASSGLGRGDDWGSPARPDPLTRQHMSSLSGTRCMTVVGSFSLDAAGDWPASRGGSADGQSGANSRREGQGGVTGEPGQQEGGAQEGKAESKDGAVKKRVRCMPLGRWRLSVVHLSRYLRAPSSGSILAQAHSNLALLKESERAVLTPETTLGGS
jgi:hypothetical protein